MRHSLIAGENTAEMRESMEDHALKEAGFEVSRKTLEDGVLVLTIERSEGLMDALMETAPEVQPDVQRGLTLVQILEKSCQIGNFGSIAQGIRIYCEQQGTSVRGVCFDEETKLDEDDVLYIKPLERFTNLQQIADEVVNALNTEIQN